MTELHQKILNAIASNGRSVNARIASESGLSRQAVSGHLGRLKKQGLIESVGQGRGVVYRLKSLKVVHKEFPLQGLSEDVVWRETGALLVKDLRQNVKDIWHYGMTEMVNNAIDHSGGSVVQVSMRRTALFAEAIVHDDGEGIFAKIQRALDLYDPRESLLELAKGKFTTDPENHSGEGIFFSSKVFDAFNIVSGGLQFLHDEIGPDLLFELPREQNGTTVIMRLGIDSSIEMKAVFDKFAMPDEFTFAKTIVPVRLAQHEGEKLVSRSQAKRLTRRFERFKTVILDFAGVEEIGQAFADEVFRVFQAAHRDTKLVPIGMAPAVKAMVGRAKAKD